MPMYSVLVCARAAPPHSEAATASAAAAAVPRTRREEKRGKDFMGDLLVGCQATVEGTGPAVAALGLALKRVTEKVSIGVAVRPPRTRSASTAPTAGPTWHPAPAKPNAWNRPGVVALAPMTGCRSGR